MNGGKAFRLSVIFLFVSLLFTLSVFADGIPTQIDYHGYIKTDGSQFNGRGEFKFAIVSSNGQTTYWSNDGSSASGSQPTTAVSATVTNGVFNVALGDTSNYDNMSTLSQAVFTDNDSTYLRVWFNDGTAGWQRLTPDKQLVAVPYAYHAYNADTVGGLSAPSGGAIVGTTTTQTLTNKTLTSPTISSPTISSATITSPTISSPTITSGTISSATISSATITSPTISTPTVTGNMTVDSGTLYVDSSSNRVGIGDTSLTYKLEVAGEAQFDGALRAKDATGIGLRDDAGNLGLWVADGGYVGIGTADPADMLEISLDGDPYIYCTSYDNGAGSAGNLTLRAADGSFASKGEIDSGDNLGALNFQGFDSSSAWADGASIIAQADAQWTSSEHGCDIIFSTRDGNDASTTERMVVTAEGYLGVGTTAPADMLEVSLDGDPYIYCTSYDNGAGSAGNLTLRAADGSFASKGEIDSGDNLGALNFQGFDSSSAWADGASIIAQADAQWTSSEHGCDIIFSTRDGSDASTTERMAITAEGYVGIGDLNPGAQLDVEQSGATVAIFNRTTSDGTIIEFQQAGNPEGSISVTGATIDYNTFTGSHLGWGDQTSWQRGQLVIATGFNKTTHNREFAAGETVYGVAQTSIPNDKRVFGVYAGETTLGEQTWHKIYAVGDGFILVTDTNGDIEAGDYLTSSEIPGYAQCQDAAALMNYTVGKAMQAVNWENEEVDPELGFKKKLIACTYTAG